MKNNYEKGVGLLEVLISLLLLAVSVLGFTAMQLRSVEVASEGSYRVQGINLARDLGERMRSNRLGMATYRTQIQTATNQSTSTKNCYKEFCTAIELADFDVSEVRKEADRTGMSFNLMGCQGATTRQCIYVAWNQTSATNGTDTTACTNGNAYQTNSQCVILEAF